MTILLGVYAALLALWMVGSVVALVRVYRDLQVAQDRLLKAWREGVVVPPREEAPTQNPPLEPLPALLRPFVEQWESKESQLRAEGQIRQWLGQGWKPERIAKHLADAAPGT